MGNQMFQYAFLYALYLDGKIPNIYLQDEKYFFRHRNKIKELYNGDIGSLNKISIHVRLGKNPAVPTEPAYVDNPFYNSLTKTDYYKKAMELFPSEKFLVFSDDIEQCKKMPVFKNCEFMEGGTELEDFNTMASCKGHIIANSSFSWWAAYVGGGKTVAPSNWYADGRDRTVIPSSWIRI